MYRDPVELPALLAPSQELVLWERVIEDSGASGDLLDAPTTAATAATAWNLMHSLGTARARLAVCRVCLTLKPSSSGCNAVETKLKDNHWLTASQLPQVLTDRIRGGNAENHRKLYLLRASTRCPARPAALRCDPRIGVASYRNCRPRRILYPHRNTSVPLSRTRLARFSTLQPGPVRNFDACRRRPIRYRCTWSWAVASHGRAHFRRDSASWT